LVFEVTSWYYTEAPFAATKRRMGIEILFYSRGWYSVFFFTDPGWFFILVFHLKQKHEEGQRLLHYLRQKNDPLAICSCVLEMKRLMKM